MFQSYYHNLRNRNKTAQYKQMIQTIPQDAYAVLYTQEKSMHSLNVIGLDKCINLYTSELINKLSRTISVELHPNQTFHLIGGPLVEGHKQNQPHLHDNPCSHLAALYPNLSSHLIGGPQGEDRE